MALYLVVLKKPVFDRGGLGPEDTRIEGGMSLARALSPWIILIVLSLISNEPWLGVKKFLFDKIAMPWSIIPKQPEKLRVFWQAYWWILVSSVLALPFLKATGAQVKETLATWWKRAPRPSSPPQSSSPSPISSTTRERAGCWTRTANGW